ncbi:hypothetical protein C8Q70DRAFT_919094 [Cubamyces menziesii]|nr:hypothetical protein C8Q70DRAFT_919094 [Cubamyces menziesii]
MALSGRATISAMMRTCRTLYHTSQSSRLLLQNGVILRSDSRILAFSRFMLADPATRFKNLRTLTFARGNFSDMAVDAIRKLLGHPLLSIDTLVLNDSESVLCSGLGPSIFKVNDRSTPLIESFVRLTTLKHLEIDELDVCAGDFLDRLHSNLVSASVEYGSASSRWNRRVHPDAHNPIVRLANSADTLEVLKGSGFNLPPAVIMYDIVYPRVRKIEATFADHWLPSVVAYARAYPNLKHLVLNISNITRRSAMYGLDPFLTDGLESKRCTNKEDQTKYGSWKGLRVIEGGLAAVYALGLVCKVSALRLEGDVTKNTVHYLDAVLCDTRPQKLSVTIVGGFMFDEGSILSQLLAKPAVQRLATLEMELCFAPSEGDSDMAELTSKILLKLADLPLRKLVLTLNYGLLTDPLYPPSPRSQPSRSRTYYCPAEQYLAELDLTAYARRFGETISTLESVLVLRKDDPAGRLYMFGPCGRGSREQSRSRERSPESDTLVDPHLVELGFGGMQDDDEIAW